MAAEQGRVTGREEVVGIRVELPTRSPRWNQEIQRAEGDGSGSPVAGTETILATVNAARERWTDTGQFEPLDSSKSYVYRYRLVRPGADVGSWSGWSKELVPTILSGAGGRSPNPRRPQVSGDVDVDQTVDPSIVTCDWDVYDPEFAVDKLEFVTKAGAGSFGSSYGTGWDRSTGTIGSDVNLERGEDVNLQGKHLAGAKLRVTWTDRQGVQQTDHYVLQGDVDEIAEVVNVSAWIEEDGTPGADAGGDDDTAKIHLTHTTDGSEPADPTKENADQTISSRAGSAQFSGQVPRGNVLRVKARGEDANGNLGGTDTIKSARQKRGSRQPVEWTASEDRSSGAGTGTLKGEVVVDGTYKLEILKVATDGSESVVASATGVTSSSANNPLSHSESLGEKVNTLLYGKVTDEDTGNVVQETSLFSFDPDSLPDVQDIALAVNPNGTVDWDVLGDVDAASGKLEFDFDDDGSTDETATFGDSSASRSGSGTTSGTVSQGDQGSVTVTLYSETGQSGNSRSKTVPIARERVPVEWSATEDRDAGDGTLKGDVVGPGTYKVEIIEVKPDGTETTQVSKTGVTDGGADDPVSYTASLEEKTNLLLYGKVTDEDTSQVVQVTSIFAFDPDSIPNIQELGLSISVGGKVRYDVLGDTDTESGKLEFDFDGDGTVDETVTFGDASAANSASGTTSGTVDEGDDGDVTITLYSKVGQSGNNRSKTVPLNRLKVSVLRATIDESSDTSNDTTLSIDAAGTDGTVGPVEVRVESLVIGSAGSWTLEQDWTSSLPVSVTVSKNVFIGTQVRVFVRDAGDGNKQGAPAMHMVRGKGGLVNETFLDSVGRPTQIRDDVNNRDIDGGDVFDKSGDDLSDVQDGGGFGKVADGALGGSGEVDLGSGSGWLNKHGGSLVRGSGETLTVEQTSKLERTRFTTEPDAELYTYDEDTSALTGVAVGVREAGTGVGANAGTFDVHAGAETFSNVGDEQGGLNGDTDYHVAWNVATDSLVVDTNKANIVGEDIIYFGMINSATDIDSGDGGAGPGENSDGTLQ